MATQLTSGTSSFNLDLTELVEEAFERAGRELRSGYDLRTARRSLNLLFAEWANRGINMWTIEQGTIDLVQGVSTYALPNDTVDLLEHVVRTQANQISNQADLTITRISVSTYATLPNKLQQARPIQVWVQRMDGQTNATASTVTQAVTSDATTIYLDDVTGLSPAGFVKLNNELISYSSITQDTNAVSGQLLFCGRAQQGTLAATHIVGTAVFRSQPPAVTVWPTPDGAQSYQFVYWRMRRTQDAGGGVNVMDVPFRFVPAMAAGLAFHIANKIPEGMPKLEVLKAQYDEAWELAAYEDHEKAAIRFVPRQQYIGSSM
jgi:hypothetical protein